jgi:hypothetical protein
MSNGNISIRGAPEAAPKEVSDNRRIRAIPKINLIGRKIIQLSLNKGFQQGRSSRLQSRGHINKKSI